MNKIFDPTKPCQTVSGLKVEILSHGFKPTTNGMAIVGIVTERSGTTQIYEWPADGCYYTGRPAERMSLVNIEPKCADTCNSVAKEPALNLAEPVQTRDGIPVTILASNLKLDCDESIVGLVDGKRVGTWNADGSYCQLGAHSRDLINVPKPPVFDPTKPARTRDGRPVRVICSDAGIAGVFQIVGILDGFTAIWKLDGKFRKDGEVSFTDLVNF